MSITLGEKPQNILTIAVWAIIMALNLVVIAAIVKLLIWVVTL